MSEEPSTRQVLHFPHSRSLPADREFRELGCSSLALHLKLPDAALTGHWCSRCVGIWFGLAGEAECPVCGNRNG